MYDNDGEELLSGYLGTTINSNLVFKCLKRDEYNDGSVCMEWMHRYPPYSALFVCLPAFNLKDGFTDPIFTGRGCTLGLEALILESGVTKLPGRV